MTVSTEYTLRHIADSLSEVPGVLAVVLGGSRASGASDAFSDIDIGVYYERAHFEWLNANLAAQALDDGCRENLIGPEGSWGEWVNFGAWLTVKGQQTDIIFRDIDRVEKVINETDEGIVSKHYHYGHPHAFINVMYRGELARCRPLWNRDSRFDELRKHACIYPAKLKRAMTATFLDEAEFTRALVRKSIGRGDVSYLAGLLFRGVSALNQTIFAVNEQWCLNEKKAVWIAGLLPISPHDYRRRVESLFTGPGIDSSKTAEIYDALCSETRKLIEESN